MATKWLSPAEMAAWLAFIETTSDLMKAFERDLAPFGLDRGDYQLLAMLSEAEAQRLRMSELAETLRLTRSGLTRRIEGVVKKRLVTKVQCPEDGRVFFAQLTPKGFQLLQDAAPSHLESVRALMIDLLSPAEIKAFSTGFGKIAKNLSALPAKH
jgi:DNA-binding MarR family transcriptional regulator